MHDRGWFILPQHLIDTLAVENVTSFKWTPFHSPVVTSDEVIVGHGCKPGRRQSFARMGADISCAAGNKNVHDRSSSAARIKRSPTPISSTTPRKRRSKYAIVLSKPSSRATLGAHPNVSRARPISGCRCRGSSEGKGRNLILERDPVRANTFAAKLLDGELARITEIDRPGEIIRCRHQLDKSLDHIIHVTERRESGFHHRKW